MAMSKGAKTLALACLVIVLAVPVIGTISKSGTGYPDPPSATPAAATPTAPVHLSPAQAAQARKAYAAMIDRKLIDRGIESKTECYGTTLIIHFALAGRVVADRLSKGLDFDELKAVGFKKVILTDDNDSDFTWKVN